MGVLVEIWSDVVCPWCAIGKRRFDRALAGFPQRQHVEVVLRSFELDPSAPVAGRATVLDVLGDKYGGREGARRMVDQVVPLAAEEGWHFDFADAPHRSTRDAHRLLHLALAEGGPSCQGRLNDALLSAYFERAADLGDHAVLTEAAGVAGLDPRRVTEVLGGPAYDGAVTADQEDARRLGVTGVPFVVLDRRLGVSGAQSVDLLRHALTQTWDSRAEVEA